LALLHHPLDELTLKKFELSLGMEEVGQGVILPVEVLHIAILSELIGVRLGVVPLGMPLQGD